MHGAHAALLEPAFHRQIEVGRVDADEYIRLPRQHALAKGAAQFQQARQMPQHFGQAHHRQLAGVEPGLASGTAHRIAADTDEFGIGIAAAQCVNQAGTEDVAGCFAGDQGDTWSAHARAGNREWGMGNRCGIRDGDGRANVRTCTVFRFPIPDSGHRSSGRSAASMNSSSPRTSSLSRACSASCSFASASGRPATYSVR